MTEQKKKDIQSKLLLTINKTENEERGRATVIRVVDWISDGKHYPQLEKREFFRGTDGEWKLGKAKGFNAKDMTMVMDQWNTIMRALGSKLPEHQESAGNGNATPAVAAPAVIQQEEDF